MSGDVFHAFFLIFFGAALIASVALYTRQPIIVSYIVLGALLGPFGFAVITEVDFISEMSHVGIVFLLFLLGLDMQPAALISVLKQATFTGILSCALFGVVGFALGISFSFTPVEALVLAMASMFSSTIVGIKLLPTTVLHHKHAGELMVGLLLIQDFLAIFCLLVLQAGAEGSFAWGKLASALVALPLLTVFAFVFVRFCLAKLITRFDRFQEFIFLLAIGWCLGLAHLAELVYLSPEIGAFIAGIMLATSPISQFIALNLKPLRDFFLVLFFFAVGAQLNIDVLLSVAGAVVMYVMIFLALKPLSFYWLLRRHSEKRSLAWDISFRLGQNGEFSLLIAVLAASIHLIGERASVLIQCTTILSIVLSSYIVIFNFPNPIAVKERLRRD